MKPTSMGLFQSQTNLYSLYILIHIPVSVDISTQYIAEVHVFSRLSTCSPSFFF